MAESQWSKETIFALVGLFLVVLVPCIGLLIKAFITKRAVVLPRRKPQGLSSHLTLVISFTDIIQSQIPLIRLFMGRGRRGGYFLRADRTVTSSWYASSCWRISCVYFIYHRQIVQPGHTLHALDISIPTYIDHQSRFELVSKAAQVMHVKICHLIVALRDVHAANS